MKCLRHLGLHKKDHQYWLNLINQSPYVKFESDIYNDGPLVELLEQRISHLVGKPQSLLFNKGTSCQLALLKTVCMNKGNDRICIHPQSHIAFDEEESYKYITGLEAVFVGNLNQPIEIEDLQELEETPSVLVIEMPLRRAGFKLSEWDDLLKIKTASTASSAPPPADERRRSLLLPTSITQAVNRELKCVYQPTTL